MSLKIAAVFLPIPFLVLGLGIASGRAQGVTGADDFRISGYRLEMRACQATSCQPVHASRTPWRSHAACEERAQDLLSAVEGGRLRPPVKASGTWRIEVRCAPVLALRSA